MGAGVVKPSENGRNKPTSSSKRSTGQRVIEEMACESCAKQFTLLRRKKQCSECGCYHCPSCVLKDPTSSGRTPQRRCHKCLHLLSGNFTRQDLTKFKVKDLQNFLRRRNVNTRNCKEKHDLIELVLKYSVNSQHKQEQELYRQRLLELQRRKREAEERSLNDASQSDSSASMQSSPSLSERNSQRAENAATISMPPPPPPESPAQTPSPAPRPPSQSTQNDSASSPTAVPDNENSSSTSQQTDPIPEPQPSQAKSSRRANLNDIPTEEHIETLTVRQLKEILATNYVDYKGCCEKWELVNRVQRLWQQKESNDAYAQELEEKETGGASAQAAAAAAAVVGDESDVCKVCMDAIIDCVLLECGHMVSCTKCGRQLSECPICRQYVVRVVHTFKA